MRILPFCLLIACLAAPAQADEYHFETFRYGQRAMGMGGAVTGLAFEPAAVFYNPAGLSTLKRPEFSGALTFVGLDRRKLKGGIRDEDFFTPRDATSSEFVPRPITAVAATRFKTRHAIAVTSFLASETDEAFDGQVRTPLQRGTPADIRFTLRNDRRDRLLLKGLTYAYQATETLSFGISVYWLKHARRRRLRRAQFVELTRDRSNLFNDLTGEESVTTHGALIRAGVLWIPDAQPWSVGLACTSPSRTLVGSSTYNYTLGTSGNPGSSPPTYVDERITGDGKTQLPAHCRAGGAWQVGDAVLSGDVAVHLPTSYRRYEIEDTTRSVFDGRAEHELTVNGALGLELRPSLRWPLRMGLFTNRTSAPAVPSRPTRLAEPHVDLYGATVSLGHQGEKRSINFGLEGQFGAGHDTVGNSLDTLTRATDFVRLDREEWRVVFFVSGAAAFAKEAGASLLGVK